MKYLTFDNLYNTGRWTNIEHSLFLFGLNNYDNNFNSIIKLIPSRNKIQLKTHYQKFKKKYYK